MKKSAHARTTVAYQNNPFYLATDGLELLVRRAPVIGIALAVIGAVSAASSLPTLLQPAEDAETTTATTELSGDALTRVPVEAWLTLGVLTVLGAITLVAIGIFIRGVLDYTAAQIARDKQPTLTETFQTVLANFWPYTWVVVLSTIKILLWTLLFIIPGIIMAVRYSLAGVAFFDKKFRGNKAITHSSGLVKNAWLTTFASQNLFNLITLGVIQPMLVPGTNALLYRQLDEAKVKPAAHRLSWLTLLVPLGLLALIIVLVSVFAAAFTA